MTWTSTPSASAPSTAVRYADQPRRIADVADRYAIPMIKITGGQRIDLVAVGDGQLERTYDFVLRIGLDALPLIPLPLVPVCQVSVCQGSVSQVPVR